MLEELSVRNYALIENISLSFEKGFNVLTGETGAGKSIIVGSISFLMGAKTDPGAIRTGAEEASVTAVILLDRRNRDALEWLKARDIESEDNRIIVRRSIKTSGRASVFIQNVPVSRGDLEEFMGFLFDLHGQHNHESLLRKESHRRYLDQFAGLEDEALAYNRLFLELAGKRKAMESSLSSERDRESRLEILNYAVEEIGKAALRSGESRDLEGEARRLGEFEKLTGHVETAAACFFDEGASLLGLARRLRTSLDAAAAIDPSLEAMRKRFEDLYYEAEDLSGEFRSYRDRLAYDPARLEEVEERLALLFRLKKKYAPDAAPGTDSEDAVLAYRLRAEEEIETLSGAGENRERLKTEIAALEKEIGARAASLRAGRIGAAVKLGERIIGILGRLGMPKARFSVDILPKGKARNTADPGAPKTDQGDRGPLVCGPWGAEDVEFLISANTGEPLRDLARIASGGELSRVMLAIKTALLDEEVRDGGNLSPANDYSAETLVFDEIDTGIGGEVALSVGEYLGKIGEFKQIFCVTHLASIAVRADNHFRVEKKVVPGSGGDRTLTTAGVLGREERKREIARMLAGDSGKAALAYADDLLEKYGG
ncbi:MAG: DNA repair protein RecN [Treponema sp.]|jgi:DNA repair protein RecN (Recombination protein N)|nr:DNA repair protein RecN [Treponema sp.]